jgi:hypothetical protein
MLRRAPQVNRKSSAAALRFRRGSELASAATVGLDHVILRNIRSRKARS